ncbi:MAG: hypothetical protein LAO31_06505 [Acidobacteriia bacterium]|nr:hypothetical protein [Terriglobia bacterium]
MNPAVTMQSSSQRYRRVLFLALLAGLLLLPIWLVEFPPLLDYPNHLAQAFVLTHLDDPNFHFSEFYGQEWHFYPYLAMNGFLIAMQHVIPLEWAGRIFLCICLLAMPLCVWFFLRQSNPGNEPLSLWALLLSYNVFFLYGYLNFYLGVALCFLALGLWIRFLERASPFRWLVLLAAVTGVYATHLFAFAMLGIVITAHLLWKRTAIRHFVFSWLLFLPGILFYLRLPLGVAPTHEILFDGFGDKMDWLTGFLRGYSPWVGWLTLVALLGCALLAWWRNAEFRWNREWAVAGGVLFILFWILPVGFGEAWDIYPRVLPFLFIVFLSFCHVGKRARWLALVALALFFVRIENITEHFLLEGPRLTGLAQSFDMIPKNARVLPIIDGAHDGPVRRTYYHFWAYGAIRRGWLLPNLLSVPGMAALRLKSGVYRPDLSWDLDYSIPPDWNKVHENYEYVWAYHVSGLWPDLQRIGSVIFQKEDLKLYRLNKSTSSTDQSSALVR